MNEYLNKIFDHVPNKALELSESFSNLPTVEVDNARFYYSDLTDSWYASVTTVTGWESQKFFSKWREKPENRIKLEQAYIRGNAIHDACEKYLNNESGVTDEIPDVFQNVFLSMIPYLNRIDNVHLTEKALVSDKFKLAGRPDCIAEYEGKLSVIDFKGAATPKKESKIQNYFQQATAYSLMYAETTGTMPDQIVICMGCEDGMCAVYKKSPKDYIEALAKSVRNFRREFPDELILEKAKEAVNQQGRTLNV